MIFPGRVFGRPGCGADVVGRGDRPDLLAHVLRPAPCAAPRVGLRARVERHVAVDALALQVVRIADRGGLRHLGWATSALSTSAVPMR